MPASDGAASPVVQPFAYTIDPGSRAATAPRRVHGYLWTTITSRVYEGYGPVYLSPSEISVREPGA